MPTTKPATEMRRIEQLAKRTDKAWSIAGEVAGVVAERVTTQGWVLRPGGLALCRPYLGPNSIVKLAASAALREHLAELHQAVYELAGVGPAGHTHENQGHLLDELDEFATNAGAKPGSNYLTLLRERYASGLARALAPPPVQA
jgi:hypothetical protein